MFNIIYKFKEIIKYKKNITLTIINFLRKVNYNIIIFKNINIILFFYVFF